MNSTAKTRRLVESGLMISAAIVLSYVQISGIWPQGGSITLCSFLPLVIIGYRYGTGWGILTSLVYSLLRVVLGMSALNAYAAQLGLMMCLLSTLFDFILAGMSLGLGGIFRHKIQNQSVALALGAAFSTFVKFICHFISGFLFFGSYAEWFFGQEGFVLGNWILSHFNGSALFALYSLVYNASYMLPEIIITSLGALLVSKALKGLGEPGRIVGKAIK